MKFTTQVAFWSALLSFTSLLTFAVVASVVHNRSELEELDTELKKQADHFLEEFSRHGNDIHWINQREFDEVTRISRDPHIFTEIVGPNGRVLAQSLSLHGEILGRLEAGKGWSVFSGRKVRTLSVSQGQVIVRMASDLEEKEVEQQELNRAFLFTFPVMLLCVCIGAWFISKRALQPVRKMAAAASRISASALDAKLPVSSPDDEIGQLACAFNETLGRLSASFEQATRFSADASHELKTPLAVIRAILNKLMNSPSIANADRAEVAEALDQVARITGITESLLLLSRADSGRLSLSDKPVIVAEIVDTVIGDYASIAEDKGITMSSTIPVDLRISGTEWALRQIIVNLIDNGLKYNVPNGRITVECRIYPKTVHVRVANTSERISPEDATHLFDRFWRSAHTSDIAGTGLGLSIARELARAAGGELALIPSAPGWTRFELTLKRESDLRLTARLQPLDLPSSIRPVVK